MKKIIFGISLLTFVLVFSIVVLAQGMPQRYLVKSDNAALHALFGIQHRFENGFTTDLSSNQVKALEKFGVGVEEVGYLLPLGKPVCGDGICQGHESRTCSIDCPGGPDPDPEPRCEPSTQVPYGISMVNGGSGGAGVVVAVLDTGVNINHPDLTVSLCKDTTKRGIKEGCNDGNGHGTHVAGTIAANGGSDGLGIFGVAPDATLWAIKVCKKWCWNDDIAEAIYYATDQGANVISMSLGGSTPSSLIKSAVDYAVSNDVLVVAAAGNSGPDYDTIEYPGAYANVVAVGAIDGAKSVVSFSSRGVNDGDYIIEEREVEVATPGIRVLSTWKDGCYSLLSGTSMATPHYSGLAAKLWQGNGATTRTYLQNLAKNHDLHTPGDDPATGFGLPIAPAP